jgi:hypothetical protein
MALARYQSFVVDASGNVQASPTIEVRSELTGALAALYSDRAGATPITNPFTGNADGSFSFHVLGGAYRIIATKGNFRRTVRYKGIGTAAEFDITAAAAAAGQAAVYLLDTQTASASAQLDFLLSGYDAYFDSFELRGSSLRPSSDGAAMWLRIGTGGGPTYQAGASDYAWQLNDGTVSPAITASGDSADNQIKLANSIGNDASESFNFNIFFSNPESSTIYKMFGWQGVYLSPHPEIVTTFGSGRYIAALTAITAVRILPSTGTITSGSVSLYGFLK